MVLLGTGLGDGLNSFLKAIRALFFGFMSNTGLSQRTIVDIVSLCVHLSRKSYGHQFPLLAGSSKLLNAFP